MNYYLDVLKKYAVFNGRARRKEYWMFVLFNIIASMVLSFVDGLIGTVDPVTGFGALSGLYSLAVLIPSIAVSVRRLHDVGKNGAMLFIVFIPIVGGIWLLVLMVGDSMPGDNEFGANPKDVPNPMQ